MLTSEQNKVVGEGLQNAYVAGGGHTAIQWDVIIPIIVNLISGCIKPPTPAGIRAALEADQQGPAVWSACLEYGGLGWYRRHNGAAISAAFRTYGTAKNADGAYVVTDDVLAAAID